jgi:hypothetical protein
MSSNHTAPVIRPVAQSDTEPIDAPICRSSAVPVGQFRPGVVVERLPRANHGKILGVGARPWNPR